MENQLPLIIADTYKIIGEIGAGGGGIVYLAEHLRLNKKVVLKADRRTLSAKPEVLRREVDALKNLSHTYIPQVYDFIVEEGTIYTVMDYIDGESFDRPLKRGERYTQAHVIEWAGQLLDALTYLHSRPPHGILHADIKPANVMLTPQGDVRLIDFNIALALGEEGVIAVGRSFGYASPEHYGIDYSKESITRGINSDVATNLSEDTASYIKTVLETGPEFSSGSNTSGQKDIMLDVRSDIYSLGATLYHIMEGERPDQDATKVKPLSAKVHSPAVIKIIAKAMNPDPDLRYQSAEEMLLDFERLRENDPRTKRHKRAVITTTIILTLIFLAGSFTIFIGQKQLENLQNAYVLTEYSANALRAGDVDLAIDYALQALPEERDIFTPPNTPEAQKALTDALNIYDLSDGFKVHKTVKLPSAPLYIEISPSGKTAVAAYAYSFAVFDTDTSEIIVTLPGERSALSEVKYLGEDKIVYAGNGGIKAYDIVKNTELWAGKLATSIAVSEDYSAVATVYKDEGFATVYDAVGGDVLHEVSFGGKHQQVTANDSFANPKDNLLALNGDGTMLGASFSDGSLWVYDLLKQDGDIEIFDNTSGYTRFEGGFYKEYFGFSGTTLDSSVFAIIDTVEMEQTGGFESESPFGVETDKDGIYIQTENMLVKIHPITGDQEALVTTSENIINYSRSSEHTVITTKDDYMFFDKNANLVSNHDEGYGSDFIKISGEIAVIGGLDTPSIRIIKFKNNPQAQVFAYDSSYNHDEARLSADRKTVMLFSYNQFRLYDIEGNIITEVDIPDAVQLYDQQYRRDEKGSRLEVIYNDGKIRSYSAVDGSLIDETMGEKPDLTLYEEHETDTVRIESPLHGVPTAYDIKTGKLIGALEKDDYLTYVTQVDDYIITEYVTAEGERYGLLLNQQCETLAKLPYLCDIVDGQLIFDDHTGNLRKSRIYHINELTELARKQKNTKEE